MRLSNLTVQNIRRISKAQLEPDLGTNLICGANGSGKTSLLESIYYLSAARSFRTAKVTNVITHGEEALLVSGSLVDTLGSSHQIGVEKNRSYTRIKINGQAQNVASAMARLVPILTFNSESYALLDGGPANRRALLDRLLFHVEPSYLATLKQYFRALKQRNTLLRNRASKQQFGSWNELLATAAKLIDDWRADCVAKINQNLADSEIADNFESLVFEYRRGWLADGDYVQLLADNWQKDSESLNTSIGPHRAELRLKVGSKPAKTIVSRGQGKLIISAIVGAQARYLRELTNETPILLVDDLASELDREARSLALSSLLATGSQLFLTAIESTDLPPNAVGSARMFHVEQGVVRDER